MRCHLFAALLLSACFFAAPARAQLLTHPDETQWPDTAGASSASVGISWVEAGRWQHDRCPTGKARPGDPLGKELAQPLDGLPSSLRIDEATGTGAPFLSNASGQIYTASVWVCARPTDKNTALAAGRRDAVLCQMNVGGVNVQVRLLQIIGIVDAPDTSGLALYTYSESPDDEGLFGAGRDPGLGYFAVKPMIRFDDWVRVSITLRTGPSGSVTVALNGQTVSRRKNLNTTGMTAAQLNSGWTLSFPGWTGLKFELGGIESWRGADWPGYDGPQMSPARFDCAWRWPMKFIDGDTGAPWEAGGTAASSTQAYGIAGAQPWRTRLVSVGEAGQSVGVRSTVPAGALPYNADGWATLCWPMVRCSTPGTSLRLGVESVDGGTMSAAVTLEQGRLWWSVPVPGGGTTTAEMAINPGDVRWAVSLHLHRDGHAAVSAIDMTNWYSAIAGSAAYSAELPLWHNNGAAGSAAGHVRMNGTFNGAGVIECDGVSAHRWLSLAMVDSYTSTPTTGMTPLYHTVDDNDAGAYSVLEDASSPGHFAQFQPIDGGPVWQFPFTTGRSGSTTYLWGQHILPGMASARGVRYVMFAGAVNDISLCSTEAQTAWILGMSPGVLESLIGSLDERKSMFTWVLPAMGPSVYFHRERSLDCYRAMWDAAAGAYCGDANEARFSVALPGPVAFPDGVHYLENSGVVSRYIARTLQPRPACGVMPCSVADMGKQGGTPGADGVMDNNDFIVFIDRFFNGSLLADIGGQGGLPAPDSKLDNNDFIEFVDMFFTDCMR
jgi:hypothetical protein